MCFFTKKKNQPIQQTAPTIKESAAIKPNIAKNTDISTPAKTTTSLDEQSVIVLLWLLSQKSGYTVDSFKVPKTITSRYNLDVASGLRYLFRENLISEMDGKILLSEHGTKRLKEYNCYVMMHLHPEYNLTIRDFITNPQWHTITDDDIAWGIFNGRILKYTKARMWGLLHNNYSNMATLLLDESKPLAALDFVFAAAFLETSGMMDDNVLTVLGIEIWNRTITVPLMTIAKQLNLTDDNLRIKYRESKLVMSLKDLLPFYYYDIEEACEFMIEAFLQGDSKGIFTEQMLKQPLKKSVPDENETQKYFYNSTENLLRKHFNG